MVLRRSKQLYPSLVTATLSSIRSMVEEGYLALASRFDDRGVGVGYQHDILEGYGAIQI